jgi:hypothetical protein
MVLIIIYPSPYSIFLLFIIFKININNNYFKISHLLPELVSDKYMRAPPHI